jgi:tryptophan halogenase
LESTGLAIAQAGIEILASMLDARFYDIGMTERYNLALDKFYNDILLFIIPHYSLTNRTDTEFWRAVRQETVTPNELQARLEVFRKHLPTTGTKGLSEVWMFRDVSWFSVLLGMQVDFDAPVINEAIKHKIPSLLATKRKLAERLLAKVPHHYDYLRTQGYRN